MMMLADDLTYGLIATFPEFARMPGAIIEREERAMPSHLMVQQAPPADTAESELVARRQGRQGGFRGAHAAP